MPEVMINLAAGRSNEQKRQLMLDITEAVMKNCNVPADAVTVQINEAALINKMKGGKTFEERMKK